MKKDQPEMKSQVWVCYECNRRGAVYYRADEGGVHTVMDKIEDHHRRISPSCKRSIEMIRVIDPLATPITDIAKVMEIPEA